MVSCCTYIGKRQVLKQCREFFALLFVREFEGTHAFSRGTLARLKMLWNYFRSSLPTPFFEPTLFRISQTELFLESIAALFENCKMDSVTLTHQAELDWVYA